MMIGKSGLEYVPSEEDESADEETKQVDAGMSLSSLCPSSCSGLMTDGPDRSP